MKVKLLKKVRKRFEITHMPAGFTEFGEKYEFNLFRLTDSTNEYYERYTQLGARPGKNYCPTETIFHTEKECIYALQRIIIGCLRYEGHRGRKDAWVKSQHKKVWYIKK